MGWDRRGYYYRVKKVKGRVVREYVGRGKLAAFVADVDALERQTREAQRAARRAAKAEQDALDADVQNLIDVTDLLVRAALLAAGYRQHHRGEWRKQRVQCGGSNVSDAKKPADAAIPTSPDELQTFLKRARNGDRSTLPLLYQMMEDPTFIRLYADVGHQAEQSLLRAAYGDNLLMKVGVTLDLERMRVELASPSPTPLVRMVVQRVVACWRQVQDADLRYAQGQMEGNVAQAEYQQRRQDRAHRRWVSAIDKLALARKAALPLPALQVNMGSNQVNVAGACPGAGHIAPDTVEIVVHTREDIAVAKAYGEAHGWILVDGRGG